MLNKNMKKLVLICAAFLCLIALCFGFYKSSNCLTVRESGIKVTVIDAKNAGIPERSELKVQDISDEDPSYKKYYRTAARLIHGRDNAIRIKSARFMDISIMSDGNTVQPQSPVSVKVNLKEEVKGNVIVVHFAEEPEILESHQNKKEVDFSTSGFSVYGFFETELSNVLESDYKDYHITMRYDNDAGIPETASLHASEITIYHDDYDHAVMDALCTLSDKDNLAMAAQAKVFDIAIMHNGTEIEPKTQVDVEINYKTPIEAIEGTTFHTVHIHEEITRELPSDAYGEKEEEIDTVTFETDSFSRYAFLQKEVMTGLDGNSFAIIRTPGKNNPATYVAIIGQERPGYDGNGLINLESTYVIESTTASGYELIPVASKNGTDEIPIAITNWTFHHVQDNLYNISCETDFGTRYLSFEDRTATTSSLRIAVDPYPVAVYAVGDLYSGSGYDNTRLLFCNYHGTFSTCPVHGNIIDEVSVCPECGEATTVRHWNNRNYIVNNKGDNGDYTYGTGKINNKNFKSGFQAMTYPSTLDKNCMFSLYSYRETEDEPTTVKYKTRKLSAQNLENDQEIMLFLGIPNADGTDTYYAVDGNGNLIPVYEEGDLYWFKTEAACTWKVIEYTDQNTGEPNGYYDFYNEETDTWIAPTADGVISDNKLGVILSGKAAGKYMVKIEGWDGDSWTYYGAKADLDEMKLVPAPGEEAGQFFFATPQELNPLQLHTVETVDSKEHGIEIQIYNFPNRAYMSNVIGNDTWYQNGTFRQGLVQNVLGEDGLPISAINNKSFSNMMNSSTYIGEGNHLFLQSAYDMNNNYVYSAFDNFAHYDQTTGDFTVYDEQGVTGATTFQHLRGQFFPFNTISASNISDTVRSTDGKDLDLPIDSPVLGNPLYKVNNPEYQFGMTVEANFMMPTHGLDMNGDPIVYNFIGDDDLWVFVDNVLVLDIGGVHGGITGTIDYTSGIVTVKSVRYETEPVVTTIEDCFRAAGRFPNGDPWMESRVSEFFEDGTFVDYSMHQMKMIYFERGAGSSSLSMRFNIPVVEANTFAVTKEVAGTTQQQYSDVDFAYQAFIDNPSEPDTLIYPGITLLDGRPVTVNYEGTTDDVPFHNNEVIGDARYDRVFYLKHGETAVFNNIPDDTRYYVQEINVSESYYNRVIINEAEAGYGSVITGDGITVRSSTKNPVERQRVNFINDCSIDNTGDLRITKMLENPDTDNPGFEFRITLEGHDGLPVPYSRGAYYIVKEIGGEEHYFKFIDNVLTDQGTEPVVCSTSGQWGTIAGVPDGYTVIIKDLMTDTHFLVEEIRNPEGYIQTGKTLTVGTYSESDEDQPWADGQMKLGEDAEVLITNKRTSIIYGSKVWVNEHEVMQHGTVRFALFKKTGSGEVLAENDPLVMSPVIQELEAPSTRIGWSIDSYDPTVVDSYVVREIDLNNNPIAENGLITVLHESMAASITSMQNNIYSVTYTETPAATANVIAKKNMEITNTECSGLADYNIIVSKRLKGGKLEAGEFRFNLYERTSSDPVTDELIGTVTNDANGKVLFAPIHFTPENIGESHIYVVQEVDTGEPGVTYDLSKRIIEVNVIQKPGDGNMIEPFAQVVQTYIGDT